MSTKIKEKQQYLSHQGNRTQEHRKREKVVASAIEHISVLNPMKELQKSGFKLTIIPVDSTGIIDIGELEDVLTKDTTVTSIMYANNEIGTIEPIKAISEIVHEKGLYLHVDATAAAGCIPIDVQNDGIDPLTLSSNDLYGPQGAGALYIKPGVRLQSILPGGGQERGLRSRTENVFAIAGMGEAARIAKDEMAQESKRLQGIRDGLISEILKIDEKHEEAHGSMVLTLGRSNEVEEIPIITKAVKETVQRLRELTPL